MVLVVKDNRAEQRAWGESKQRVQIMLTPTAIDMVDGVAEEMEISRTEVIERLIRSNCLNVETLRQITPAKSEDIPPPPSAKSKRRRGGEAIATEKDVQGIPNGTRVKVPRGWEAVVTGYLGEGRYSIRYDTGLPGDEDEYPLHLLTVH